MKKAMLIYILGMASVWLTHLIGGYTYAVFVAFFVITFIACPPQKSFSPLTIFYAYYGAWFVVAPHCATRYAGMLMLTEYSLGLALAYSVFGIGVLAIDMGDYIGQHVRVKHRESSVIPDRTINVVTAFLYLIATVMVLMIIRVTGGFARWIADPGEAFLNRGGSGVFVILSHFSSITLAALVGYISYRRKQWFPLICFIVWVLITSPVHGSKLQISLLIITVFIPWFRTLPFMSGKTFMLYVTFGFIFLLGLYFRNVSWLGGKTIIPYALNYFTALENLAMSVRDFHPGFITTFFLPFVKLQTPFGLSDPKMYFDMNHYLTDIYYPHAWAIRATEQWPVETDLYLNFMFVWGLPLVFIYLFVVGYIHGRAQKIDTLGCWVASFLMTVFMISHLRGSLINHTDFYMYPFIFCIYFLLGKLPFKNAYFG
ncbi:polymerase [Bdellovibrio bacteriovorus]|uniref:polymerase n=1 Tax=Bdellovibrio bacteriovorus TaxID=959 RepID=UPI0035A6DBAF